MVKRIRAPFATAEQRAEWLAREPRVAAEKLLLFRRAQQAVGAEKIALTNKYLMALGSDERLGGMLKLIAHDPPEIFWPVFVRYWPHCDNTWKWNSQLVEALRRVGPGHRYADRGFFDSLPDPITVYRGASRARIRGAVAWTTDIEGARCFAQGHRGITVPDPVVATGTIAKRNVFWATNDRPESEILGLPREITIEELRSRQTLPLKKSYRPANTRRR